MQMEPYLLWGEIVLGVLLLTCGWALYRTSIAVICLFVGAVGGGSLAHLASRFYEVVPEAAWVTWTGAAIGGIIGLLLIKKLYYVGVFISAGLFGLNIKHTLLNELSIFDRLNMPQVDVIWQSTICTVIFAVLCGLIVIILHRFIVILLTSGVGAFIITSHLPWPGVAGFLFVSGVLVQMKIISKLGIDTGRETGRWKQERTDGRDEE